jgi:type VI protein secretion system component Hcp
MPEEVRDVLMKVMKGTTAIAAECQAVIGADDANGLAKGFTSPSANNSWTANYFAVQDFMMEIGVAGDSDSGGQSNSDDQIRAMREAQQEQNKAMFEALRNGDDDKPLMASKTANEFARFMKDGRRAMGTKSYSANLEPVSITKMLDTSSLELFQACINSTTLKSAVLIKRRGGGGNELRTYLRIEFTDLLITDFNWEEEDVIKEKIKFVCRKAQVQYSIENNDGTLKPAGQPRTWSAQNLSNKPLSPS